MVGNIPRLTSRSTSPIPLRRGREEEDVFQPGPSVPPLYQTTEELPTLATGLHVFAKEQGLFEDLRGLEDKRIPPDTHFVIGTRVFDGVGDLEHCISLVKHMRRLQRTEPFQFSVYLERGEEVPEEAWRVKVGELRRLGCYMHDAIESIKMDSKTCWVYVSVPPRTRDLPFVYIHEYLYGLVRSQQDFYPGIHETTVGIWMDDNPVFRSETFLPSQRLKAQLFGTLEPGSEQKCSVGFGSLRADRAKLEWISYNLSVSPIIGKQDTVLVLSQFSDPEKALEAIKILAEKYQYEKIVVVDKEGSEQTCMLVENSIRGKILRIVHQFIEESDMPALLQLARKTPLGGAGDTSAFGNGFGGDYPPYVEARGEMDGKLRRSSSILGEKGYPNLKKWFYGLSFNKIDPEIVSTKLQEEWIKFKKDELPKLNMAPWVTLLLRYGALKRPSHP